jgi:Zn-dependent peptidase ImmA (M78 family)/transcriptional regulator with XRE-family HTH domain
MSKTVQPEMLILARESRGLSQSELSRATSISQANISKYESGLLRVSDDHLEDLAFGLHYPKSYFYQREMRYHFGSSCTYHRKRQSLAVSDLRVLLATLNNERIRIGRLLNGADVETEQKFEYFDIDMHGGDPVRVAQLVRNRWKLPLGPIPNLVRVIENAGGIVFSRPFGTTKLDAISQWVPGTPPIFMVNADIPGDRLRFSLAHEIGHLLMHEVPTATMETEADRFAAEFLMPAHEILPFLDGATLPTLAQLKPYWRVAISALIKRAADLGRITPRQYRSFFEQMSKLGYRITEPFPIPVELPTVYTDLITVHQQRLGYSTSELSELLHLHVDEFTVLYCPKPDHPRLQSLPGGLQDSKSQPLKQRPY